MVQELASRLGLPKGSFKHYGTSDDVNSLLLISDVALYGSSQEFQEFPPLLIRAMSFGIPIVVPDYPVTKSHVSLRKYNMLLSVVFVSIFVNL